MTFIFQDTELLTGLSPLAPVSFTVALRVTSIGSQVYFFDDISRFPVIRGIHLDHSPELVLADDEGETQAPFTALHRVETDLAEHNHIKIEPVNIPLNSGLQYAHRIVLGLEMSTLFKAAIEARDLREGSIRNPILRVTGTNFDECRITDRFVDGIVSDIQIHIEGKRIGVS